MVVLILNCEKEIILYFISTKYLSKNLISCTDLKIINGTYKGDSCLNKYMSNPDAEFEVPKQKKIKVVVKSSCYTGINPCIDYSGIASLIMEFIDEKLENYSLVHTEKEPEILKKLNRETCLKVMRPRMISGHLQGRFLSMLSHMICPKRVLEIGTHIQVIQHCVSLRGCL